LLGVPGSEVEACRRDLSAPFQTTLNADNLDAQARSLQYLVASPRGFQDALQRGFAMDIKIARLNPEKSLEDYKVTFKRIALAEKSDEMTSTWEKKGRDVWGNLLREAKIALKKAKDRESAEARMQTMEASRDKLIVLTNVAQDEAEERS
jgi:hypothetical protein